eukprot:Pgem_evm1s12231
MNYLGTNDTNLTLKTGQSYVLKVFDKDLYAQPVYRKICIPARANDPVNKCDEGVFLQFVKRPIRHEMRMVEKVLQFGNRNKTYAALATNVYNNTLCANFSCYFRNYYVNNLDDSEFQAFAFAQANHPFKNVTIKTFRLRFLVKNSRLTLGYLTNSLSKGASVFSYENPNNHPYFISGTSLNPNHHGNVDDKETYFEMIPIDDASIPYSVEPLPT